MFLFNKGSEGKTFRFAARATKQIKLIFYSLPTTKSLEDALKTNAGLTRVASSSEKLDDDGKNILNLLAESTKTRIYFP